MYTHAELNIDRLLRDVEGRLAALEGAAGRDEGLRHEVMDALREAIARERRGLDPSFTVEWERERRQSAEQLRGALEAIHGSVRPDEALDEVLKQLGRVVHADFSLVAVAEPGTGLRVAAVSGAEAARLVGAILADPRLDAAGEERRAVRVRDAEAEGPLALAGAPPLRSWVALPLLLEGDVVGMLSPAAWPSTPSPTRTCCGPRRWPSGPRRRCAASSCRTRCGVTRRCSSRWWRSTSGSSAARAPTRSPPRSSRGRAASGATAGGCSSCRRRGGRSWPPAPATPWPGPSGARHPRTWRRRRRAACPPPGCWTSPSRWAWSCPPSRSSSCPSRPPTAGWGASRCSTRTGSPRRPAPRGLRLARGRRLAPRRAAPRPPVTPAASG